jgi:AraC-like DNA-binding protein
MIKLYLELFLIHIFRRHDTILKRERYTLSPQQHFEVKLVDKINAYLNENIYSAITIAKISNYLGVSPSLVKKVYKAQTGESVMDTFIHLKIDEAKRLIREEDLNFSQIAEKLNYGSVHYFSRIFKAKTEMTPTEYSTSVIGTVPKVIMQ